MRGPSRRVTEWITITGTVLIKTETEFGNREWNPQLGHCGWSTGQVLAQGESFRSLSRNSLTLIQLTVKERKKTSRKQKMRPFFPQSPGSRDRLP